MMGSSHGCAAGHENNKHCLFAAFLVTDARAKRVVSGSEDHSIVIWDLNSKQARLLFRSYRLCHPKPSCNPLLPPTANSNHSSAHGNVVPHLLHGEVAGKHDKELCRRYEALHKSRI